ncbi:GH25 family lysozyme [Caviibacter abscessus]|uniref:GH25 family lysozyme n=1 Tax=Caviibacter abscessus TaxID=1766719 RepID=UPI000AEB4F61|nr:GH25 family lysozyme [Caviibacter abscessus]
MKKIKIFVALLMIINLILILVELELAGYIYHNDILAKKYTVHGIDISHHQTRINWSKVDKKYKFVLMKATEGKDFLDKDFSYNWNKAQLNGFKVGAYHFFSMRSSGIRQANYYISKVPKVNDSFPPIIDVEVSSRHKKELVISQLKDMISKLEEHYGKKVIIYVDYKAYKLFIENELKDNPIWIRDIRFYPNISEDNRWIIWQYSNRGRVKGIDGFTDKNVLRYDDINWYLKGLKK